MPAPLKGLTLTEKRGATCPANGAGAACFSLARTYRGGIVHRPQFPPFRIPGFWNPRIIATLFFLEMQATRGFRSGFWNPVILGFQNHMFEEAVNFHYSKHTDPASCNHRILES